jgi:hypothetical protein
MNLLDADTDISDEEYLTAFNVLNRDGGLEPVNADMEIGKGISGIKQGVYSIGAYLVVFSGGKAYYKVPGSDDFTIIEGFEMSSTVERVYVAFVPASITNSRRYLTNASDNTSLLHDPSVLVQGSPQSLVVQDGVSQPLLIFIDEAGAVKTRKTNTYDTWTTDNREYVPIGLDMAFIDGILFVLSPDRTRLYRSVTGRPLDFVVNVTTTGDKGGNAETTKYAISYANTISLFVLSNTSFLACTDAPFSYVITLNRERTIFGEPTFIREDLFSPSAVNSFSVMEILGDTVLITQRGVRSFNASRQNRIESENAVFSKKIARAFKISTNERVLQDNLSSSIVYDDYALFSLNSIYGPIIAIYDTLNEVWSSFVTLSNSAGKVKQFASLIPHEDEIYAITTDDKILKLFSGDDLNAFVATKRYAFDDLKMKQKLNVAQVVIEGQLSDSTITVAGVVNNKVAEIKSRALVKGEEQPIHSTEFPYTDGIDGINSPVFDFSSNPKIGWKIGYNISWGGGGVLSAINHVGIVDGNILDQKQKTLV